MFGLISYEEIYGHEDEYIFIDVRSQKEAFEEPMIGSVNIPVLLNEERDVVGTLYVMQPFVTLATGLAGLLTFVQVRAVDGLGIFVISYLFNATAWQLFCVFQFLLTPFALLFDKKMSGKLFVVLGLYACNVFIQPYLVNQLGILDNIMLLTLFNVAYIGIFLIGTLLFLGKRNFQMFYRYLIYPLYILTWIPITIQGIIDKDKKEWSHTKHVRQIGIYEV